MTHKITVTGIEHIGWARRLLIRYHLHIPCSDPSVGGWEYIPEGCGYRSVCDEEWIVISPNTQHPQHSSIIKYAGDYTFVWDYGGVYGIDPSRFDSEHSYIVQIALADHTCGYVDPCANANYLTQFGEEPTGTPGTDGDLGNTDNNCGEGYRLVTDVQGCLFCEEIVVDNGGNGGNPGNGTGGTDPNDPWVFDDPPVIIGAGESEPTVDTGDGDDPTGDPDIDDGDDTVYTRLPPMFPMDGVDYPDTTVITSGPMGPRTDIENAQNLDLSESLGAPPANMIANDAYGAGSNIQAPLKGHTMGGRASRIADVTEMNAYVSHQAREMITPRNAAINRRHSADHLNISPNDITNSSTDSINNFVSNDPVERSVTKATDAINLIGDSASLINRGNYRTKINTDNVNNEIDQIAIVDSKAIAQKNHPLPTDLVSNSTAAQNVEMDLVKYAAGSPGNRNVNQVVTNDFINLSTSDNQNFSSNFKFNFIAETTVRAGDGIFCEAMIIPTIPIRHRLTLKIVLTSRTGSREIATSKTIERSGAILISKVLSCNIEPGVATVSAVVYDGKNIVAIRNREIVVTDPGSRLGITSATSISSSIGSSSIDALINYRDSIVLPIGPPNYYRDVLCIKTTGVVGRIPMAFMVRSSNPNIKYGIEVSKQGILRFRNVGELEVDGIKPTGNYGGALYAVVNGSEFTQRLSVRVSSVSNVTSFATLYANSNYYIPDFNQSLSTVYSDGSATIWYNTPYLNEDLSLFEAPANGVVPSNPTLVYDTTNAIGDLIATVPCTRHGWIGIAFRYPEEMPLTKRIIKYVREDSPNV